MLHTGACTVQQLEAYCAPLYLVHKYLLSRRPNHDNHQSIGGPKVPQAHTRHHRHLGLAESVWIACLEATDVPYALTPAVCVR